MSDPFVDLARIIGQEVTETEKLISELQEKQSSRHQHWLLCLVVCSYRQIGVYQVELVYRRYLLYRRALERMQCGYYTEAFSVLDQMILESALNERNWFSLPFGRTQALQDLRRQLISYQSKQRLHEYVG